MYEELITNLRNCATVNSLSRYKRDLMMQAADAIKELNKRIDFLMNCIYEAEDSLDRGTDNDWARTALEKARRGQDDV